MGYQPTRQCRGPRQHALAAAHAVLSQPSLDAAATQVVPWLECIAGMPGGPSGWLVNRTTRTVTMDRLIHAATAGRHHVGHESIISAATPRLGLRRFRNLIDTDIYRRVFASMLGGYESTGRMYVSPCVLRVVAPVRNWSDAAGAIGLDPVMGRRTARAASNRMSASPSVFARAVDRVSHLLPAGRDFRLLKGRVRMLARQPDTWCERWRTSTSPARRPTLLPYAVTWMWCAKLPKGVSKPARPGWGGPRHGARRRIGRLPGRCRWRRSTTSVHSH